MHIVTEEEVVETLRNVMDPELHRCLVELGMVRKIGITDGRVDITVSLTIAECPRKEEIKKSVENIISDLPGIKEVKVSIKSMAKKERATLFEELTAEEGKEPECFSK